MYVLVKEITDLRKKTEKKSTSAHYYRKTMAIGKIS